jgi:hypothetical protein
MKLYREYACDASVLELLNEEENVEYGMTLLNLSKILLNKGSYSQIPVFFETNNQIKDRIMMIKGFKKGSYRMTGRAVLGCGIATFLIFTNNLAVKALNAENIIQTTVNNTESLNNNSTSAADAINNNPNVKEPDKNAISNDDKNSITNSNGKWIDDKEYKLDEAGAGINNEVTGKSEEVVDKAVADSKLNKATTEKSNQAGNQILDDSNTQQKQSLTTPTNSNGSSLKEASGNNIAKDEKHVNTDTYKVSNEGWQKEGNNWTYIKEDGKKSTGWVFDQKDWYYFNQNGVMEKDKTIVQNGKNFELGKYGALQSIDGRDPL